MHILLDLFLSFMKIGLFTFGGGYGMLPLIESTCVENKQWITHSDMMNITIIAESTPGPIAINCATFVGYKKGKTIGALVATIGVIIPSFIIIFLIASVMSNFLEIAIVAKAFKGIKLAVGILILDAGLKMIKKMAKNFLSIFIFSATMIAMLYITYCATHFSTIYIMLIAGALGYVYFLIKNMPEREDEKK